MALVIMVDWRCASFKSGEAFVTMVGIVMMLGLFAGNRILILLVSYEYNEHAYSTYIVTCFAFI